MATTKTLRTIIAAATSVSAGGSQVGTAVDLTTKDGGLLTIKITNGGTGPGIPASAYVMVSGDNTNWKIARKLTHSVTASAVGQWTVSVPRATMYVRVEVGDHTVNAVTCEAFLHELAN